MLTQQNATRFTKAYTSLFPHLFVSNKQNSPFLSTGNKQITKFSLLNSKYTSRHLKLFLRISPTLPQPLTLPPHY